MSLNWSKKLERYLDNLFWVYWSLLSLLDVVVFELPLPKDILASELDVDEVVDVDVDVGLIEPNEKPENGDLFAWVYK